ncbi:hypothetical protein BGW80DRAFT_617203 [Lactifluus volemus]|nr:hypothetical protein BGW80DRAFT_617203 [Lactifluus volemus]
MEPVEKGVAICFHCRYIALTKCSGRSSRRYDLQAKLLMHNQFAEHDPSLLTSSTASRTPGS